MQNRTSVSGHGYEPENDRIERTIYIKHITNNLKEQELLQFFNSIGELTNLKITNYPNGNKKFALVEFKEKEKANESLNLSGTILKGFYIDVTKSKYICLGDPPQCLKNQKVTVKKSNKIDRTIYVSNIDPLVKKKEKNF